MKEHLLAIREGIRAGRFVNEAAVSQGIVLRVLHALSWPTYDTDVVSPEYSVEGRRVDFALCDPRKEPVVFIEVKQIGQSDGADRQLFEYAFHRGVPMAILTDGQEWHFFLPAEQGDYGERRVYKLDILERDVDESIERLMRYLDYKRICTREAIEAARNDYRDVTKERRVRATLPEAWRKLIEEADESLINLMADKVESLCGYKPDADTVIAFLRRSAQTSAPSQQIAVNKQAAVPIQPIVAQRAAVSPTQTAPAPQMRTPPTEAGYGFIIKGQRYPARNVRDVFVKVMQHLADRNPRFLEDFAAQPQGNKRRYLARSREALYPDSAHLRGESVEIRPGWWLGVNVGRNQVERIVDMACGVAGLRYGTDVRLFFG